MPRIGYSLGFKQGLECRRRPNHRKSYWTLPFAFFGAQVVFNIVYNLVPKYL